MDGMDGAGKRHGWGF